jgi:predicted RNase H-like nuclease
VQLHQRGSDGAVSRSALVDQLRSTTSWLDFIRFEEECRRTDDAVDAVSAAMTARAAAVALIERIPEDNRHDAEREGWIAFAELTLGRAGALMKRDWPTPAES